MLARLNRGWRLLATGLAFTVFGLGGSLLASLAFPLIRLGTRDPELRQRRTRRCIRHSFRFFRFMLQTLGVIRYRAQGIEQVCTDRNTVIVANHPTLIDYVLLAAELPNCDCIVKQALWHNPFLKGVVKGAGYIPNSAGEQIIETCKHRLFAGGQLLIFPEGTRSVAGQPLQVNRGAAQIALRAQADLRFVHIRCHPPTLSKAERWYQIPAVKPCFELRAGIKIEIEQYLQAGQPLSISARQLSQKIKTELSKEFTQCLT